MTDSYLYVILSIQLLKSFLPNHDPCSLVSLISSFDSSIWAKRIPDIDIADPTAKVPKFATQETAIWNDQLNLMVYEIRIFIHGLN